MKHLTDGQLQDYLDGNRGNDVAEIETHLACCTECRDNLEQYSVLFGVLEDESDLFALPDDFADKVADAAGPIPTSALSLWGMASSVMAAVVVLVGGIYFLATRTGFFTTARAKLGEFSHVFDVFGDSMDAVVTGLNLNGNLLATALLILGLYAILDRVIAEMRHSKAMFLA